MQQIRESDNSSEEDFVYLGCTYSGECIVRIPFSSEQTSDCTLETKWSRRSKETSRIFPLRCSPGLECSAVGRSQNPRNGHQALEWNRWTLHCIWSTTMDDTLKQRYAGNMYKHCPTAGYTNTGYGAYITSIQHAITSVNERHQWIGHCFDVSIDGQTFQRMNTSPWEINIEDLIIWAPERTAAQVQRLNLMWFILSA